MDHATKAPRLSARSRQRRSIAAIQPAERGLRPHVARTIDVTVSAFLLAALSPLCLLIALAIRLEDGGPVFYLQDRIGRGGRYFRFAKFRSMRTDADRLREALATRDRCSGGVRFKDREDPRVTRVGRVLRRLSLDELPQLVHVLRGDMALVGPRPPIPTEVAAYDERAWRRLGVTPGLTCFWQVGGRSELSFDDQVVLDIEYIERRSVWLDLQLLMRTVPAVLSGRGAW